MAKKIKRWMSTEVLPAIRKTGRYVAPAAPVPDVVHETLSHADIANLTRMVWLICGRQAHRQSWTQAVWYRLRQVCQCPTPNRFQVRHLPLLAAEVKRLAEVSLAFTETVSTAERTLISRVIRQGKDEAGHPGRNHPRRAGPGRPGSRRAAQAHPAMGGHGSRAPGRAPAIPLLGEC